MDPNTHEEFIHIPGMGNAFITGVPDKCDHDYSDIVYLLGNGDTLLEKKYRCPTNEATQEYIEKIAADRNTYICGGTTACTKCGKEFTPPMF